MVDTETYRIEAPDGDTDTIELPEGLVDVISDGEETPATVVADVVLMAFVQRAHALAHHSHGETDADVAGMNERAEELFEERFGISYAEATGHSH